MRRILVLNVTEGEHHAVAVTDEEIRRRQLPAGRAASPTFGEGGALRIAGDVSGGGDRRPFDRWDVVSRRGDAGVVLERGENEGDRERDGCSEDD